MQGTNCHRNNGPCVLVWVGGSRKGLQSAAVKPNAIMTYTNLRMYSDENMAAERNIPLVSAHMPRYQTRNLIVDANSTCILQDARTAVQERCAKRLPHPNIVATECNSPLQDRLANIAAAETL